MEGGTYIKTDPRSDAIYVCICQVTATNVCLCVYPTRVHCMHVCM